MFSTTKQNWISEIQNFLWRKIIKHIWLLRPFPSDKTEIFWFLFMWFCIKTAKIKRRELEKISEKVQTFYFSSFGILIFAWNILLVIDLPNRKKNPYKISSELEILEKYVRSEAYEMLSFRRISTSRPALTEGIGQQQLTKEQQQLCEKLLVTDIR